MSRKDPIKHENIFKWAANTSSVWTGLVESDNSGESVEAELRDRQVDIRVGYNGPVTPSPHPERSTIVDHLVESASKNVH